jgi:hypothetical protein
MSNAAAAYYTYLAHVDRDKAATLRRFGYHASAEYVDARARAHEVEARRQSKRGAPFTDAPPLASPSLPQDLDLHTPSAAA